MKKVQNPKKTLHPIQFTQEGYDKLQVDFDRLTEERKGAVETLAAARALGDLSENGLYTAAKGRLRSIDSQLFRLEMMLKLGFVKKVKGDIVEIGTTVVVNDGRKEKTLTVVGGYESDPLNGKISQNSPLGKALLGKKVEEKVTIEVPAGKTTYTIRSIQ